MPRKIVRCREDVPDEARRTAVDVSVRADVAFRNCPHAFDDSIDPRIARRTGLLHASELYGLDEIAGVTWCR
jgi:hypothetical protein